MQEVINEMPPVEKIGGSEKTWEDTETWAFLYKSVCHDNPVSSTMVHEHQRNSFVSKMTKLRDQ